MHNVQQNKTFVFQPRLNKKIYIYCIKNMLFGSHVTSNISLTSACSSHIAVKQLSSGQISGEFIRKYVRSSRQKPHMRLESYECLHEIRN